MLKVCTHLHFTRNLSCWGGFRPQIRPAVSRSHYDTHTYTHILKAQLNNFYVPKKINNQNAVKAGLPPHLVPLDEFAPLLESLMDGHGFELQRVDSRLGPGHGEALSAGANALTPAKASGAPPEEATADVDVRSLPPTLQRATSLFRGALRRSFAPPRLPARVTGTPRDFGGRT